MDFDTAKTHISNVVTSIKDCADVGMYTFSKMSPQLAAFVGLGLFVKNLIVSTAEDANSAVLKDLKEVKHQIRKLNDAMGSHFNDMKAFIVAHHFYTTIAVKASVLTKAMGDCSEAKDQKKHEASLKFFKEMYDKHSPLELAKTLREMMDNEVTNPVKMAMTGDKFKTKRTFESWTKICSAVFTQLFVVEAFASGQYHEQESYRQDKISEEHAEFESLAKEWKEHYKTNETRFWEHEVRPFVEDIQEKNTSKSNVEKADLIRAQLDKILTNDIFYVVVMSASFDHSTVLREGLEHQHIQSANRGGCTVIVYQSKKARSSGAQVRELRKKAGHFKTVKHRKLESSWISWTEAHGWLTGIEHCGYIELVRSDHDVAVRCTSAAWSQHGPGISFQATFNRTDRLSSEHFHLVFGFE
ncbi:hypothetical protein L5515_010131 [Caenorhabditis briggsae]|uniref:Uncharacterized protein n=1 Tax=Caenorhabditis briggsae TaxID=6238 RepID=A0AAE9EPF0_CAEBR|nr:hypothetical protein L5515_010131 [Caenorhabditis briggsae]